MELVSRLDSQDVNWHTWDTEVGDLAEATMVQFDNKALANICEEHDVIRLRIFGSAARGEERPDSDVDVIVEFRNPKGFFSLLRLERSLSEFFGRPVDLVTEPGLSPYIRDAVLASAAIIFDAAV